jgi:membrane protein DedA with SNARE-associated domain
MDFSAAHLLAIAGKSPLLQALAIILGTFILEDAATVASAMGVQAGKIDLPVAILALYVGIVLGDIGLYGMGRLASAFAWARRLIPPQRQDVSRRWLEKHVFKVVFVSRFMPGARLPTYTACGFLHANFRKFTLAAIGATLIWTTCLFTISLHVGKLLMEYLGAWRWVGAAGFVVAVIIAGRIAVRMQTEPQS